MKKNKVGLIVGALVVAGAATWYFSQATSGKGAGGAAQTKGGAQTPPLVSVVAPQRRDVGVVLQANGTVTPLSTVDLRPQTTSTIRQVHIKEGQFVKSGDLMFSLDDRADRANLEKAQAEVARDRATLADLERQYKRSQDLVAQKFIAQSAVDTLRSQVDAARAALSANVAAVRASRVSTSYSTIRAPMSGRVGAINVYPGSLVQPATSMTTLTQLNPINVSFTLPESSLASLMAAQKRGPVPIEASVGLEGKPITGTLSFVDNTVDPSTGVIRVKGQFDNSDTSLWPGQYVNTRVTVQTLKDAVVIPEAAIITNAHGTFVYVTEKDQSARLVPVARVYTYGLNTAVSGLTGDEQVVTEGKQNVRPGGKIRLATTAAGAKGVTTAENRKDPQA